MNLDHLRNVTAQFCDAGKWSSALFWADKLLSLSDCAACDIVLYVRSLVMSKQYLRALSFLQQRNLTDKHRVYQCFAAECLLATKQYEEVVKLVDTPLIQQVTLNDNVSLLDDDYLNEKCEEWRLEGAIYLYMGQACEELDNRAQAASAYAKCLRRDVYCYDALYRLNKRHLMTCKEKIQLLDSMPFLEQCGNKCEADLLRYVYETLMRSVAKESDDADAAVVPASGTFAAKLSSNACVLAADAERLYYGARFADAYKLTSKILKDEEFHTDCLIVHICLLVQLEKTNELFKLAHKLVDTFPDSHVAWYAVACYYVGIGNFEAAKRFFHKCTLLDPQFGEGWVGYGHSFACEQEHDQAMNCYVKAAKLMSSSHIPLLYVGLEYSLTNNLKLGEKFLQEAAGMTPDDPHILHEMGVLFYRQDNYVVAERHFRKALEKVAVGGRVSPAWESLLNNLGHTLRKLKRYQEALNFHQQALVACPKDPSTFAAIGYLHMFLENFDEAIDYFHQSLSIRRDDSFAKSMLSKAMEITSEMGPFFDDVPKFTTPENPVVLPPPPTTTTKKSVIIKLSSNGSNIVDSNETSSANGDINQSSTMDVDVDL